MNIASEVNSRSITTETLVTQHSIPQTILLHLLPGALITIGFILLGPWLKANRLPPLLALLIPILVILIPFELGLMLYLGYRRNGRLSLEGIVLNREPLPRKDYLTFAPALLIWPILMFQSLGGLDQAILNRFFNWLPDWFLTVQFTPADYSQPVLKATFVFFLLVNGIAGPMVEELYFRGFLLPRIEYLKAWSPLVNITLFSVYHFFSPWQNITRILAFLPWAFTVRWKKNIYLSMLAHCFLNIGYCFLSAHLFF
ncbi:MAG TPA: CPBP family intramembrane glutamic endopeptidase [Anaerolineaceae bacterium]|nr:CPBP family intramembrane glutamic endopeptidase [Anaerolineaceae bacterium]